MCEETTLGFQIATLTITNLSLKIVIVGITLRSNSKTYPSHVCEKVILIFFFSHLKMWRNSVIKSTSSLTDDGPLAILRWCLTVVAAAVGRHRTSRAPIHTQLRDQYFHSFKKKVGSVGLSDLLSDEE